MTARSRSADDRHIHTGTSFFGGIPPGTTVSRNDNCGQERSCNDHIGNFPNVNPFESHSKWSIRSRHDGELRSGSTVIRKLVAYPSDRIATPRDPRVQYGVLDPAAIKQQLGSLLVRSSPSSPSVSLPTSIGELKDFGWLLKPNYPQIFRQMATASFLTQLRGLPSLLRTFGNTLMGMAANGYISWRWVVRPMISDIRGICKFVSETEKRQRMLAGLASGKSIRRRVNLSNRKASVSQPDQFMMTSTGYSAKATWKINYSEKVWGTCRWRATSAPTLPKVGHSSETKRALSLVAGITSFELLKTAWELTPWSWFADWFGSLGDNIALYNNSVPAYWVDACIMRTLTSESEFKMIPGTMPSWATEIQPHVESWTIKERFTSDALWLPLLPSGLPLMDSSKWSILSALAVSSIDRGLPAFYRRMNHGP